MKKHAIYSNPLKKFNREVIQMRNLMQQQKVSAEQIDSTIGSQMYSLFIETHGQWKKKARAKLAAGEFPGGPEDHVGMPAKAWRCDIPTC